ncbi:MAG TPA: RDD family protein [Oculatellaceae cyanobacterium]
MDKSSFSFKDIFQTKNWKQKIVTSCAVCGEVCSTNQEKCSGCMLLAATDESRAVQTPMLLAPLAVEPSEAQMFRRDPSQPVQSLQPPASSWQTLQQNANGNGDEKSQSSDATVSNLCRSGSFVRRLCAGFIDGSIITLICFLYSLPSALLLVFYILDPKLVPMDSRLTQFSLMFGVCSVYVLPFLMPPFYHAIFESTKLRATPGKFLLKLIVTAEDGQCIPFERTLVRVILQELLLFLIAIFICTAASACTSLFMPSTEKALATLLLNIFSLCVEFVLFAALACYPLTRHKQSLLDRTVGRFVILKSSFSASVAETLQNAKREAKPRVPLPVWLAAPWKFCRPVLSFGYWCTIVVLAFLSWLIPICAGLGDYAVGCLSVYVVSAVIWHILPKAKQSKFASYLRRTLYGLVGVLSVCCFAVSGFHCEKLVMKYIEADRILEPAYQLDSAGKKRAANEIVLKARKAFPERFGLFSMMSYWDQNLLFLFKGPSIGLSYKAAALDPYPERGLYKHAQTYMRKYMREFIIASGLNRLGYHPAQEQDVKSNPRLSADRQKSALLAKEFLRMPKSAKYLETQSKPAEDLAGACELIAVNSPSEGVKEFTAVIAKYPRVSRLYILRAECYANLKQPELEAKDKATAEQLEAESTPGAADQTSATK